MLVDTCDPRIAVVGRERAVREGCNRLARLVKNSTFQHEDGLLETEPDGTVDSGPLEFFMFNGSTSTPCEVFVRGPQFGNSEDLMICDGS